jgi:hypothetical protein
MPSPCREGRRHRGEAVEGDEADATTDLLLKHPDATLATNMKHLNMRLNTLANTLETIVNIRNIKIKHSQHICETYATFR